MITSASACGCFIFFFTFIDYAHTDRQLPLIDKLYDDYSHPLKEQLLHLLRMIVDGKEITGVNLTFSCVDDLKTLSVDIRSGKDEAIAILDSFTHQRSGLESGIIIDIGDQSQCEDITFHGHKSKYYLAQVTYPAPSVDEALNELPLIDKLSSWTNSLIWNTMIIRYIPRLLAVCLPSSCTHEDIKSVLESHQFIQVTHPLSLSFINAQPDHSFIAIFIKTLICASIIFLSAVNLIGSTVTLPESSTLRHFNIIHNYKSLMKPPSQASTQFVSKFKVVYIFGANLLHHLVPIIFHALYPMQKPLHVSLAESENTRLCFGGFSILMSLNFVISSSLSIMTWYPILSKRKLSFLQFVMIRALRSIPTVLFITLLLIIADGLNAQSPLMKDWLTSSSSNCLSNGWFEFTFLSNLADINTLCHRVSWFTSADMQLYACSFLLMGFLCKNRDHRQIIKFMVPLIGVVTLPGLLISGTFIRYWLKLMKYGLYFLVEPMSFVQTYFNPVQYALPYACGLWVGYYVATGYQLPRESIKSLNLFSGLLYAGTMASFLLKIEDEFTLTLVHLTRRITYTVAVCGFYLALWSKQDLNNKYITTGGYICTVVSRLQYPFFLIHPIVITYFSLSFGYQFYTYHQIFYMIYPAQFIFSLILAMIVHLTVESPFANLLNSSMRAEIKTCGQGTGKGQSEKN